MAGETAVQTPETTSCIIDLEKFSLKDMTRLGTAIRKTDKGSHSMEEVACRIVKFLYTSFQTQNIHSCALIRFFKTHSYCRLPERLQKFSQELMPEEILLPETKCLTLLGSIGENPDWNLSKNSIDHQAIPLPAKQVLDNIPMIRNLISQLGITVKNVIDPDPDFILDMHEKNYNVFFVPDAWGSPYIPQQDNFVLPYKIKSVLGFGGVMPSGEMFSIIIFTKVHLSPQIAELFRTLSLNVQLAILPFENKVFK